MLGNSPMGNECELYLAFWHKEVCLRKTLSLFLSLLFLFFFFRLCMQFSSFLNFRTRERLYMCMSVASCILVHSPDERYKRIIPRRCVLATSPSFLRRYDRTPGCKCTRIIHSTYKPCECGTGPIPMAPVLAVAGARRGPLVQFAYHRCTMRLPLIIWVYASEIRGKSRLRSS